MSEALEALEKLRENVRHPAGIEFGGLRDNEETRTAIVALMEFASAALEQGEAVAKVDMVTHMGDGRYHTSIIGNTKLEVGTKLYTAPPSTAEAQARALEDADILAFMERTKPTITNGPEGWSTTVRHMNSFGSGETFREAILQTMAAEENRAEAKRIRKKW